MREIPQLQILCLRAIGASSCSAEATFASDENGKPSTASRLLRRLQQTTSETTNVLSFERTSMDYARRFHANDVDLHHPFCSCLETSSSRKLILEFGSPSLDWLQAYIDALVELGRMDDNRLGIHFWKEVKENILLQKPQIGALSLHNCSVGSETLEHMVQANIGPYLAVLDLTGIRSLTNQDLKQLLPTCTHLQALSLKNCRRINNEALEYVPVRVARLDIGGCFNVHTSHALDLVNRLSDLTELHASGLGWTDKSMADLVDMRQNWTALSLSFSWGLTHAALRTNLLSVADTLTSLALAFCDSIDNAALGILGRNLPLIVSLDVRGNQQLSTLTGWYDGRTSADLPVQPLTVLARYSAISEASVDETKRIHPLETVNLMVILGDGGMGAGITRYQIQDS